MNEFYQSTICHVCKKFTHDLKRCSRCKLYAYCSKEHQKTHWKDHKQFCTMVHSLLVKDDKNRNHILDIPNTSKMNYNEFKQTKIELKFLWEHLLGRKLVSDEDQTWMFPRICEICRTSKQDNLFDCPICLSVSYCCEDHQNGHFNIHNKVCQELKLCYEINLYLFENNAFIKPYPKIINCETLPETTNIFVENCTMPWELNNFGKILIMDIVSSFLSIVFALQTCNLVQKRKFVRDSLVIHLVGSSVYELSLPLAQICEFFLHWITNLTQISLILIGPEVIVRNIAKEQLCVECSNKTYCILFERCFYHEYVKSESFIASDLNVAFNCGLHEFTVEREEGGDLWSKSLEFLGAVPLLLTSYTVEEAEKDLQRIEEVKNVEVVVRCNENKYKGGRPFRDWGTYNNSVFYQNNYLSIIKPNL